MKLQVFTAPTMAGALAQVKTVFGHDALILHTRTYYQRFCLGIRKREIVEITAARSQQLRHAKVAQVKHIAPPAAPITALPANSDPRRALIDRPEVGNILVKDVLREIEAMKVLVKDVATHVRTQHAPQIPEEFYEYYQLLTSNQVEEELAQELIKSLQRAVRPEHLRQSDFVREKLAEQMEKLIPVAAPIEPHHHARPHVIALIGPTGVGKTTTIAKLAANLKVKHQKRVGLITIDTYRIAATEQLIRYGEILGSAVRVVTSVADLRSSLDTHLRDCEYVLVDTAGRSPTDVMKIGELRNYISTGGVDEVHLVLSMTSSQSSLAYAAQRFGDVRIDKVIFSKLDETAQRGHLLRLARDINKPVSYITTGQDVPHDIEPAHGRRIAQLILGGEL